MGKYSPVNEPTKTEKTIRVKLNSEGGKSHVKSEKHVPKTKM